MSGVEIIAKSLFGSLLIGYGFIILSLAFNQLSGNKKKPNRRL